jgi:hypothetical protein
MEAKEILADRSAARTDRPRPGAAMDQALRDVVATIEREVSALSPPAATALRTSWAELVNLLALGPAPQLRECPTCHHSGMRAATVCGYCWTKLPPMPA